MTQRMVILELYSRECESGKFGTRLGHASFAFLILVMGHWIDVRQIIVGTRMSIRFSRQVLEDTLFGMKILAT